MFYDLAVYAPHVEAEASEITEKFKTDLGSFFASR